MTRPAHRRIRVVELLHTIAYGGVETALLNWIRGLDPREFEVHLVCFANADGSERPFVDAARRLGIEVSTIPWSRRKPLVKASRRLAAMLRAWDADILHTHNTYADCVGAIVRHMVDVKTITTLYVWGDFGWKRNLLQRINALAIRRFDLVTAHCEDTQRRTLELGFRDVPLLICGFESNRVELPADERSRRRRALGVADDEVLLANIARFYPEKAQDHLLRIFARVLEKQPRARLWMVGTGPLEHDLRELTRELGLEQAVQFVGFVEDLPSLLALIDIQVHPSHMEGVPLAICSGMAAGLPLVASDVGGLKEVISSGRTGVLVAPGDDERFAEEVVLLIEDPERARALGERARRFIEDDYSLARAVAALADTYREAVR